MRARSWWILILHDFPHRRLQCLPAKRSWCCCTSSGTSPNPLGQLPPRTLPASNAYLKRPPTFARCPAYNAERLRRIMSARWGDLKINGKINLIKTFCSLVHFSALFRLRPMIYSERFSRKNIQLCLLELLKFYFRAHAKDRQHQVSSEAQISVNLR